MKEMTVEEYDKRFEGDIEKHEMKIYHDEGVYRHVRFGRPETNCMHFNLTTFPGRLCYSGDMGDFTFARVNDMFTFFNSKTINLGYWTEKLQSVDKMGAWNSNSNGFEEWNEELFWENVDECFKAHYEEQWKTKIAEFKAESCFESSVPYDAVNAVMEFNSDMDFWDYSNTVYTFRIQWALRAIRWGVSKYIEEKGGL